MQRRRVLNLRTRVALLLDAISARLEVTVSDAAELVTITAGSRTFRCSRRTAAHIAYTVKRLEKVNPSARLLIVQGCYNVGVSASAGTHDFDAVLDVQIVGMDWWAAQRFLRECGWAAWVRYPPAFSWHIHMISLGYPGEVGIYVPGQVDDYYRHALGLKGQHDSGLDGSWFPPNIEATVFDYAAWQEDNMAFTDWPQADQDALVNAVAAAVTKRLLDTDLTPKQDEPKSSVRAALNSVLKLNAAAAQAKRKS